MDYNSELIVRDTEKHTDLTNKSQDLISEIHLTGFRECKFKNKCNGRIEKLKVLR